MRQKKDDKITEILRKIAPGTPIRNGLENILKARTGALLLFTDNEEIIKEIVDGGFFINEEYTSSKLYELAKMDGAIVLSKDMKRILFANAELIPSSKIPTVETGTRHRTAERTAKQTGELVITEVVLNKANQAIKTLEKYKKVFDSKLNILNEYEFNDIVTLENVIGVLQRAEMVMQIVEEIETQIAELGADGRLVDMQLEQLMGGIEKEEELIIKDYSIVENIETDEIMKEIAELSYEELLKEQNLARILGYDSFTDFDEIVVYTRGYRILNKIPRMPSNIVENLILGFKSFQHIIDASIEDLDNIEGIGEVRARNIKTALSRMQEQFVFDNIIS